MSIPATYARMLVRELRLDDSGILRLLVGSNVSARDLFRLDGDIAAPDLYCIIANAYAISGNPALGLQVGCRMPFSAHGSMGVAASTAPTPRAALAVLERYGITRLPVMSLHRQLEGDTLIMRLDSAIPFDPVGIFLMEALVASIFWSIEHPLDRPVRGAMIELAYPPPPHAARYGEFLHGRVVFGQPACALRLPLAELDVANPFADPEVHAQALQQCELLRASLLTRETWSSRVIRALQQHPGQLWTIGDVAGALHVSVRSLTRHLQAEGASYQRLLDGELRRQAQLHLDMPGRTVASVAAAIGYQDVSAFRRAFKRWTGRTPEECRQIRSGQGGMRQSGAISTHDGGDGPPDAAVPGPQ